MLLTSFGFDSLYSNETNATYQKTAQLLIDSLVREAQVTCFQKCLEWIESSVMYFDTEMVNSVIETLLQCIIGVQCLKGYGIMSFWKDQTSNHDSVKSVPSMISSNGFIEIDVPVAHRNAAIGTLVNLFHILAHSQLPVAAVNVYSWICRVSCWVSCVSPASRNVALEFLKTFSSNDVHHITYQPPDSSSETEVRAYGLCSSNDACSGSDITLPLKDYAYALITLLRFETSHRMLQESLSVFLIHLQDQNLWKHIPVELDLVRRAICSTIISESAGSSIQQLPPTVKKSDLYHAYYRILLMLIPYRSLFPKTHQDQIVAAMQFGLGRWPTIGKLCMEGLTLCLFELPVSILKQVPSIVVKISQTTSLAMAIPNLEFLSSLARNATLYVNFTDVDYKRVFGIALQYLRTYASIDNTTTFSQYVTQLGYHVVAIWFLSLKVAERRKYVAFIIQHMTGNVDKDMKSPTLDEPVELVLDLVRWC
jgi:Tuberin